MLSPVNNLWENSRRQTRITISRATGHCDAYQSEEAHPTARRIVETSDAFDTSQQAGSSEIYDCIVRETSSSADNQQQDGMDHTGSLTLRSTLENSLF